jgi:hypothetical protein
VDFVPSVKVLPAPTRDSEAEYIADQFFLLAPNHIDHLAQKMSDNLGTVTETSNHDIFLLKRMSDQCRAKIALSPIYVYQLGYHKPRYFC